MSDKTVDTMPDMPPDAGEGRVVRYRFGLPHAAVIASAVVLSVTALTPMPERVEVAGKNPAAFFEPRGLDNAWTDADIEYLRNVFQPPVPQPAPRNEPPHDPKVQAAFDALDHTNLRQLDAFLAAYRAHAYAEARGYVAQVDAWRAAAQALAEEARLKKEQSEAEWDYD